VQILRQAQNDTLFAGRLGKPCATIGLSDARDSANRAKKAQKNAAV
jgi:hypothetical protein